MSFKNNAGDDLMSHWLRLSNQNGASVDQERAELKKQFDSARPQHNSVLVDIGKFYTTKSTVFF
jgi:hypothetical protein